MSKEEKILKNDHREKSMNISFIIFADLDCLLEKMNTCHNNPKKSSIVKISKHIASGYSLFTHCSFDTTKNKLDYYKGKKCLKNYCVDLKVCATKIINHEKKIIPLTNEEVVYVKRGFNTDDDNEKYKVRDHCHCTGKYRGTAHDIFNLRYKTPKEFL